MPTDRYTIIDLGSNSFHMLTVTKQHNGFSVLSKHKQKVRLAAGLNAQNQLDLITMEKGWLCLQNFKTLLDEIQPQQTLITATAALRKALNSQQFLTVAEQIIQQPINLISGIQEAKTIFKGVSFTEKSDAILLVIDIGGASTELVIGEKQHVHLAHSLDMGCVTWCDHYFADGLLNEYNFHHAIQAAKEIITAVAKQYLSFHWEVTLGASGTIQAIDEINQQQRLTSELSLDLLKKIQQQCIQCHSINKLTINGLKSSRIAVFASGLAILIALFDVLEVHTIQRSNGALREGLVSMLFNGEIFFDHD